VKFILLNLAMISTVYAGVIPKNTKMVNVDFSLSSANSLWYGDDNQHHFSHNNQDNSRIGETSFINVGATFSYGLTDKLQIDSRVSYAESTIKNASFPNEGNGGQDEGHKRINELSVSAKFSAIEASRFGLNLVAGYSHPGETRPTGPTFLALNDFSQEYSLGIETSTKLTDKLSLNFDFDYIYRTKVNHLESDDLPGDRIKTSIILPYIYDDRLVFNVGLSYLATLEGTDIGSEEFGADNMQAGHATFYAAKEMFAGHSYGASYYVSHNKWIGISFFEKFWGRNTDKSKTTSLFAGLSF